MGATLKRLQTHATVMSSPLIDAIVIVQECCRLTRLASDANMSAKLTSKFNVRYLIGHRVHCNQIYKHIPMWSALPACIIGDGLHVDC